MSLVATNGSSDHLSVAQWWSGDGAFAQLAEQRCPAGCFRQVERREILERGPVARGRDPDDGQPAERLGRRVHVTLAVDGSD